MKEISKDEMTAAVKAVLYNKPKVMGYRILVKQVFVSDVNEVGESGLNELEKDKFPTLAHGGVITDLKDETERQRKGTQFGILVDKGDSAFTDAASAFDSDVGDIVAFDKYAGEELELPPGSGETYRVMNDESVLLKMGVCIDER
jgi:co-chaperonin GroES (HSP10)